MPDGRVLAWTRQGDLQIRGRDGHWLPARRAPVSFLESAVVAAGATYVLGQTIEGTSQRLAGHVFLVSGDGALVEAAESLQSNVERQIWQVPRRGLAPVRCTPADLSKATYRPPACHSDYPPWDASGSWTVPPFACGGALVEPGRRQLVTRSLMDGRVLATRRLGEKVALACADGSLLIGSNRIEALDPTSLRPKWSIGVNGRPVTALCATAGEIVYFTPSGPRSVGRRD